MGELISKLSWIYLTTIWMVPHHALLERLGRTEICEGAVARLPTYPVWPQGNKIIGILSATSIQKVRCSLLLLENFYIARYFCPHQLSNSCFLCEEEA